jgi:hypothetical protein
MEYTEDGFARGRVDSEKCSPPGAPKDASVSSRAMVRHIIRSLWDSTPNAARSEAGAADMSAEYTDRQHRPLGSDGQERQQCRGPHRTCGDPLGRTPTDSLVSQVLPQLSGCAVVAELVRVPMRLKPGILTNSATSVFPRVHIERKRELVQYQGHVSLDVLVPLPPRRTRSSVQRRWGLPVSRMDRIDCGLRGFVVADRRARSDHRSLFPVPDGGERYSDRLPCSWPRRKLASAGRSGAPSARQATAASGRSTAAGRGGNRQDVQHPT